MTNLYSNMDDNNKKIIQNNLISISLKDHQKTAINAMLEFEDNRQILFTSKSYISGSNIIYPCERIGKNIKYKIEFDYGILADKVGSGKTFMIMGLLCNKMMPISKYKIFDSNSHSILKYKDNKKAIKTNLIIVPHHLTLQWITTFSNCTLKILSICSVSHKSSDR